MRIRKTIAILALAFAFALAATAQAKAQDKNKAQADAPKLSIEGFTHDFGEVKPGKPLSHSFKVKNLGKADLLIKNVSPG